MTQFSPRNLLTGTALVLSLSLMPGFAQDIAKPEIGSHEGQAVTAPDTPATRAQVMPDSFADLVEKVAPAVVNITTTALIETQATPGPVFPEGSPFSDLFRDFGFPGMPPGGQGNRGGQQRSNALGSGFVISSDGFIVTNNHVIEGADEIEIEFNDGTTRAAEVVGSDPKTDIALLRVEGAKDLPYAKFGDSDKARVGDWVLALGNPLGQGFSASTGIVSARNRELQGAYDDFIQTDAAINRGNSGGPLFNMNGEVVGVNTAILSPNGGSIGIGFSMASNVVEKVINQLVKYGETRRGWLGVRIQDLNDDMAEALGLDSAKGAMVTDVPEGPALEAGIKSGDIITAFDDKEISDIRDLVRRVGEAPVGEAVGVTVLRDGKEVQLKITLGQREVAEGESAGPDTSSTGSSEQELFGMSVAPLTPEIAAELGLAKDVQGLVVNSVDPAGAAAEKGLTQGDVITEVGQSPVKSVQDLQDQIDAARSAGRKSVLMMIRRGGDARFLALPIN